MRLCPPGHRGWLQRRRATKEREEQRRPPRRGRDGFRKTTSERSGRRYPWRTENSASEFCQTPRQLNGRSARTSPRSKSDLLRSRDQHPEVFLAAKKRKELNVI